MVIDSDEMIETAKEIAQSVHGDQKDKKNYPYMSHIFDVAKRVSHLGEKYEVVALLHDAIEDAEPPYVLANFPRTEITFSCEDN